MTTSKTHPAPREVRQNAMRGLSLRGSAGGGTTADERVAKALVAGEGLEPADLASTLCYLERHAGEYAGRNPRPGEPGYAGWLMRGGEAGRGWATSEAARSADLSRMGITVGSSGAGVRAQPGDLVSWPSGEPFGRSYGVVERVTDLISVEGSNPALEVSLCRPEPATAGNRWVRTGGKETKLLKPGIQLERPYEDLAREAYGSDLPDAPAGTALAPRERAPLNVEDLLVPVDMAAPGEAVKVAREIEIPAGVKAAAKKGLELREGFPQAGTLAHKKVAERLAKGGKVTGEWLRKVAGFLQSHSNDSMAPGWGDEDSPAPSWIAWLLHGGEAGREWVKEHVGKVDLAGAAGAAYRGFYDFKAGTSSAAYPGLDRKPGKSNWVDKAGGLPSYIERIAKHLHYEEGMNIGRSIAVAVNHVKRMCSSGDTNFPGKQSVNAKSRALACKAVAEWEAKKAKAKSNSARDEGLDLAAGFTLVPTWVDFAAAETPEAAAAAASLARADEDDEGVDEAALERAVLSATDAATQEEIDDSETFEVAQNRDPAEDPTNLTSPTPATGELLAKILRARGMGHAVDSGTYPEEG